MRTVPFILLISLAACSNYPRDIEGTLDRIESTHRIRVGLVGGLKPEHQGPSRDYIAAVERRTGARAVAVTGEGEALIAQLDAGKLDLVIGEVATDSPWVTDVAVVEPLMTRRSGKATLGLSPIARNGENRWVMLLEQAVRDQ